MRNKIQKFAFQDRFNNDIKTAISLFFGQEPDEQHPFVFDEGEAAGFQEWLFFDYVTESGRRIIDIFVEEVRPRLPGAQAEMLTDWIASNRCRLLEVQEVTPGVGSIMKDLLSGEILEVRDITSSNILLRWNLILARTLLTTGRIHLTGSGPILAPTEKRECLEAAHQLWEEYRNDNPQATFSEFYRDRSLQLMLAIKAIQEESLKPKQYVTAEGHPIVEARADYAIRGEAHAVEQLLDETEEFEFTGYSEDGSDSLSYAWLLRGRSFVPQAPKTGQASLMLKFEWSEGPGKPRFRTLGDLTLWPDRLRLDCLSRERLEYGKKLLEEILGARIVRKRVGFREFDPHGEKSQRRSARPPKPPKIDHEVDELLMHEMRESQMKEWLEEPIMALGDLSPLQAVKTAEGREQVIELLKVIEYYEEVRKHQDDSPLMDVERLRRELGLER